MPGVLLRLRVALLLLPVAAYVMAGFSGPSSWAPRMREVAVLVGLTGVALVGAISLAGWLAARSRRVLLAVYGPALALTLCAGVVLVLGHALLAAAILYELFAAVSGSSWVIVPVLAPLVVAVFGVMTIVDAATARPDPRSPLAVHAEPRSREDAPDLWQCVEEVATRLDVPVPDHILLAPAWNFAAVEPGADVGGTRLEGRILVCSLLAGDVLDQNEFRAIVAHELGHFDHDHAAFTERYLRVFERGWDVWRELEPSPIDGDESEAMQALVLRPARLVLEHFVGSFMLAERALSREAELLQDALSASATTAQHAAAALAKLHVYAEAQFGAEVASFADLFNRQSPAFRQSFRALATTFVDPDALERLAAEGDADPMDSHPTLGARMARLGVAPRDVLAAVRVVPPARPASTLYGDTSTFEVPLFVKYLRQRAESGAYATGPGLPEVTA